MELKLSALGFDKIHLAITSLFKSLLVSNLQVITNKFEVLGPLHTSDISSYKNIIVRYLKLHVYK